MGNSRLEFVESGGTPFLRWAGSKRSVLQKLASFWPGEPSRYIEPFAGSAALFFSLSPSKAVLSDSNPDLVTTLQQVERNPDGVHEILSSLNRDSASYYAIRQRFADDCMDINRAAYFIYLNRLCFNGLYRTNKEGKFNVPFSGVRTNYIPTLMHLKNCSIKLKSATILNGDFEWIVSSVVKEGDFVYLDPPYAIQNRRVFRQYTPDTFGLMDLDRLANLLKIINDTGAKFVLSYAYCKESLNYFKGWTHKKFFVQRNISGFAKHRRKSAELIVTNAN